MSGKKFSLAASTTEDVTFLKVRGVVDEDNTLGSSLKRIEGRTVIIDLSEVTRINSCGVRDWVNWLSELDARGTRIILVKCSPCIVNQVNLVNNFVGNGLVKSFYAPYYCARCDVEELVLLQVEAFAEMAQPVAPGVRGQRCTHADCQMIFDDIEAAYFAFLPRNTGATVDAALKETIDSLSPTIKERIRRLDAVERPDESGPGSSVYSPLTATGLSISRDSLNITPPAEPTEQTKSSLAPLLGAMALALAAAIVAYVIFVAGDK